MYQPWMVQSQDLVIFHSIKNTMHVVPALTHILPSQVCKDNLDEPCLQNLEVAAYTHLLPIPYEGRHCLHQVDEYSNHLRQQ
jgi:hypothetical protein